MDSLISFTLLTLGALFAVLNPVAIVPPFVAMTQTNSIEERRVMARHACSMAAGVLMVFCLFGLQVLNVFGISVPAFQIAGGLVLIRVAFALLQGIKEARMANEEKLDGMLKDDISITPLGFPILCGPATITTAILITSQTQHWHQIAWALVIIGAIYFGIYRLLAWISEHSSRLGRTGILVSSRMMGLILLAVAVQFMLDGIAGAGLFR